MPRPPRQIPADTPLHIVQRGVNRQRCFMRRDDYRMYLSALRDTSIRYNVDIHAFVLMTNHVHLLATPRENMSASKMMQQLGRCYVQYFNNEHRRTGTLWEGRYKSSMIRSDRYLFACYRYIEMNPVRAGMVDSPKEYRWSSFRANGMGLRNGVITPHRVWADLGADTKSRCDVYKRLFSLGNTRDEDRSIRRASRKGRPLDE